MSVFRTGILHFLLMPAFFCPSAAALENPDVRKIVGEVDRLYRSSSSYCEVRMEISTPDWKRALELKVWTRGMDETFIRIVFPKKDAGISTLRCGGEMWNYYPNVDKTMKVPPSMMMSSWMGSDFTNDDLVKESSMLEDYNYRLLSPEGALPEYYYIELVPKKQTVTVWGKIAVTVRKEDYIPVEEVYFDEKGARMRVMKLSEIKEMGGRKIPALIELFPVNKKENKTTLRYEKAVFDIPAGEDVFTLRNLQKRQ